MRKPLRDTHHSEVTAYRYQCLCCGHTFRVDPAGVSRDHFSQRIQGWAACRVLTVDGLEGKDVGTLKGVVGAYRRGGGGRDSGSR